MPAQKPGKSKQDYGTPWDVIRAIERDFGTIDVDLAARADNAKAPVFITPEEDSLSVPWAARFSGKFGFLNPEYADIAPWAAKCAIESAGMRIGLLVPASIGSNWFRDHVHGKAAVLGVAPRITFEGCADPYPKDIILALYGFGNVGFDLWRWK